jgi:uncharacterized protein YyaL (SSP411 family)
MPNRLIEETSPYLLQHAHNPVEWFPWGAEAFEKAKQENKPVLLSIGYSACHWCHVMERESFENAEIARLMNEGFVNIKVDREERPDLDEIYMTTVQMLTGRGGWPLTVFLTPEGKPFFGGTYFPPEDRYGVAGFPKILEAVGEAYRERPGDVERSVEQIVQALAGLPQGRESPRPLSREMLSLAAEKLAQSYDREHGGIGSAPKFPNVSVLDFFLRRSRSSEEPRFLEMVAHTLTSMAEGGIYDHLGGGFHRYSVDRKWLVPHFEKMLYDNAQLVRLYVDAFRATGDPVYRRVVEETLGYVLREMAGPEGGFYATQDADSEGEEGKFFIWEQGEVLDVLGEEAGEIFSRVYDVSEVGNFEGKNILHPVLTEEQAARYFGREVEEIRTLLAEAKGKLFLRRERRIKPLRDEKVIVAWNAMMISGFAEAFKALGEPRYLEAARKALDFLLTALVRDGRLLHTYKDGRAAVPGFLDDYAFLAAALLDVYEATFDRSLLARAAEFTETMVGDFWDEAGGAFFYTGSAHEKLISRSKPAFDGSVPSGNSVACHVLLRLYHYTGNEDHLFRAEKILRLYAENMESQPFGFSHLLGALDFYLEKPKEIVIAGDRERNDTQILLRQIHLLYLPNKTLQLADPGASIGTASVPLQGKTTVEGQAAVYVCQNFTCSLPVTEWEEVKKLLES